MLAPVLRMVYALHRVRRTAGRSNEDPELHDQEPHHAYCSRNDRGRAYGSAERCQCPAALGPGGPDWIRRFRNDCTGGEYLLRFHPSPSILVTITGWRGSSRRQMLLLV